MYSELGSSLKFWAGDVIKVLVTHIGLHSEFKLILYVFAVMYMRFILQVMLPHVV